MAFAPLHIVAGPVIVTWNAVQLGYSEDGVRVRFEPKWGDIKSDDYGGSGGAPSDTQFLGGIASVTADLVKFDNAEVLKLTSFEKAGAAGVFPQYGTLIRQESEYAVLLLDGKNQDYTFSQAFLRNAQEMNKGTRYTKYAVGWECWVNSATSRTLFTVA